MSIQTKVEPFAYRDNPVQVVRTPAGIQRESAVPVKVMALDASLELLEKSVVELSSRLTIVLSPEVPVVGGSSEKEPREECQMVDTLQSHIRHVEYIRSLVDSILSRLEV